MKTDLDVAMRSKGLDAVLVFGSAEHNPPMTYLTGGGHISGALLVQLQGRAPVLFCNEMERDEAARSGLAVRLYGEYPWQDLFKQAGGDPARAAALRLKLILSDLGLAQGRAGVYGFSDLSAFLAMQAYLGELLPGLDLVGEVREESVFARAMETKDADELARIRRVGQKTVEVVGMTAAYLAARPVDPGETLLKEDGTALTIGDVQARIRLWLAERGLDPREGFIFSIGRDAAVPHSQGTPGDPIRLGRTIVFDIYPAEAGGGYFYDFTRTWCLGYAPPAAQALYDQVHSLYQTLVGSLAMDAPFRDYQVQACDIFEKHGHLTQRTHPAPLEGYVHGLGHGVGLNIHERPWGVMTASEDNRLKAGSVFTIEPGLYYPDQGLGCRIEDTYWMRPDGVAERLAEYPYDLVLKMEKWTR